MTSHIFSIHLKPLLLFFSLHISELNATKFNSSPAYCSFGTCLLTRFPTLVPEHNSLQCSSSQGYHLSQLKGPGACSSRDSFNCPSPAGLDLSFPENLPTLPLSPRAPGESQSPRSFCTLPAFTFLTYSLTYSLLTSHRDTQVYSLQNDRAH